MYLSTVNGQHMHIDLGTGVLLRTVRNVPTVILMDDRERSCVQVLSLGTAQYSIVVREAGAGENDGEQPVTDRPAVLALLRSSGRSRTNKLVYFPWIIGACRRT
jgi:hypothetical protein